MGWIESKSVWGLSPEFAEIFVGCETFEGFKSSGEVVGPKEVGQVRFELVVGVVEVSFDRSVLDGSVHPFDLPVGPGMVRLGQSVFDAMSETEPVEGMPTEASGRPLPVLRQIGEVDVVISEHGVDAIWNGLNESFEEGGGSSHVGLFNQIHNNKLRGAIDSYEQVEIAFGGSYLGQVDRKEADWIGIELLPTPLVPFDFGQPADAPGNDEATSESVAGW